MKRFKLNPLTIPIKLTKQIVIKLEPPKAISLKQTNLNGSNNRSKVNGTVFRFLISPSQTLISRQHVKKMVYFIIFSFSNPQSMYLGSSHTTEEKSL